MRLPAIAVSRWAINAEGNVYRLDGYVGIGTDSPSGLLGLGDEFTYITVNSNGEITFTDAVSGTQNLSTFAQSSSNIGELGEAIQTILKDLDGYASAAGSDGYIAFFTGANTLAGDNDLFYDRVTGALRLAGTLELGTENLVSWTDAAISHPSTTTLRITDGSTGQGDLQLRRLYSSITTPVNLGSSATTGHSLGTNDVIVGGSLEVDGAIWVDNGLIVGTRSLGGSGAYLAFGGQQIGGSATDSFYGVYGTENQLVLTLGGNQGKQLVLGSTTDGINKDYDHGLQDHPTLFIQSSIDPDVNNTQWLSLSHRVNGGYVETGAGPILMAPFDGYTSPAVDDGYSLGSVSARWKELWLGPSALHIKSNISQTETGVERDWNFTVDNFGALGIRQDSNTFVRINQDIPSVSIGPTIPPAALTHRLIVDGPIGGPTYSGSYLHITKTGDGNSGSVLLIANNDVIIGKDIPATAMIVKQDGSVGLGTNVPSAKLHVVGDGYFDGYLMPFTDDTWGLGTPDKRWRDLYLGPGSLHIKSTASQTETGVERDWVFGADANGDLYINQDGLTYAKFSNDRPISLGTQATTSHAVGAGGVIFGGTAEFDGTIFFDGAATFQQNTTFNNDVGVGANLFITLGSSANAALYTSSANAEFNISVGTTYNRNFIFTDFANRTFDHGVPLAENPTIKVFSNISPTVDSTQWISINHNQTDGYIQTGIGSIRLSPANNLVKVDGYILPTTDDAYGLGNEEYRWRDLWLSSGTLHIRQNATENDTGVERDWGFSINSTGNLSITQGPTKALNIISDGALLIGQATQIIDAGNKLSVKGDSGLSNGNAYFVATDSTSTHTTYQGVTTSAGFTGTFTASSFEIRTSNAPKITIAAVTGVTMNTSLNVGIVNQSDQLAHFFSASTAGHSWFVGDKNLDQLAFVVGSEHGQQLVFGPAYSDTTDFAHPIQSDPMMYFHSMTDPAVDPNQWISISHRKTSAYIETGLGSVLLAPFDGYTSPAVDDAYSLGSPTLRWKDLWLSDASLHLVQNANENDTGVNRQWDFRINSAGDLLINEAADNVMKLASPGGTSTMSTGLSVTGTLIGPNFQTSVSSVILGSLVFTNGPFAFSSGEQSPIFALNQTFDQFGWFGGSNCGNQFVFGMQAYYTSDYLHPDQGNPTLFLHSSTDPALDPSQWMSMVHNSVDGYIATGIGNIILAPAGTAGDGYVEVISNLAVDGQAYSKLSTTNTPAASTHTINWNLGNNQVLDLSSATTNITLAFINSQSGATYTIKIIQHPTTPVNVIWPGSVKWPGGVAPTISTGASAVDLVTSFFDGANHYSNIGQNYS